MGSQVSKSSDKATVVLGGSGVTGGVGGSGNTVGGSVGANTPGAAGGGGRGAGGGGGGRTAVGEKTQVATSTKGGGAFVDKGGGGGGGGGGSTYGGGRVLSPDEAAWAAKQNASGSSLEDFGKQKFGRWIALVFLLMGLVIAFFTLKKSKGQMAGGTNAPGSGGGGGG